MDELREFEIDDLESKFPEFVHSTIRKWAAFRMAPVGSHAHHRRNLLKKILASTLRAFQKRHAARPVNALGGED